MRMRPTIILFGDSITEFAFGEGGQVGWAGLLSSVYTRRADVLSRGFSGYNTRHALGVMPSIFGGGVDEGTEKNDDTDVASSLAPSLFCTVFFGANDASLPTARQHLSIEEYDRNMRQIVTKLRESTKSYMKQNSSSSQVQVPIILFTPPPVSSKAWDHYCTVTSPRPLSPRSNDKSREYGMKVKEIGKEMNCAVVDTFSLLGGYIDDDHNISEEHYNQYLTDGLHLNGEGNRIVFDGLMDVLKKHHPDLLPMEDEDGGGKYGTNGIPLEEKLWSELC